MKVDARLLLVVVVASIAQVAVAWDCAAPNNPWPVAQCCNATTDHTNVNSCASCAAAVGNDKAPACVACTKPGMANGCTQCVQRLAGSNREWACTDVCYSRASALVPGEEAKAACTDCYANSDDASVSACLGCLRATVGLQNQGRLYGTDPALVDVRNQCLQYVQKNKDAWAGPECLGSKLWQPPGIVRAKECLDCLMAGTQQAWQCVPKNPVVGRKMRGVAV